MDLVIIGAAIVIVLGAVCRIWLGHLTEWWTGSWRGLRRSKPDDVVTRARKAGL